MAKHRLFNIMQYEKHPITGEPLFDESKIIAPLNKYKSIKEWAYIGHDRDVYSEKDEIDSNGAYTMGELKGTHWHVVIKTEAALEVQTVAKWFGVPENFIDVPKGAGAFLDCCAYLTHEDDKQQELGKVLYERSEVKANFDYDSKMTQYFAKKLSNADNLSIKDYFAYQVLNNGMTLSEVEERAQEVYVKDYMKLKAFRNEYLTKHAPLPEHRVNYYVHGDGGSGKGLISKGIARSLFPGLADDELFFTVGAGNVTFDGYDGQPVIIWDDCRAEDLFKKLKTRGNIFNVFDTTPTSNKQNIKNSSVRLINAVNIVNSVQTLSEFIDGLSGDEDKAQAGRRFQFGIVVTEDSYEIQVNAGILDKGAYHEYISMVKMNVGIKQIYTSSMNHQEKLKAEQLLLTQVVEQHEQYGDVSDVDETLEASKFLEGLTMRVEKMTS